MPAIGQGEPDGQAIPFGAPQPASQSWNVDVGFNGGFAIFLCGFRANLSDQRRLGRDESTFSRFKSRSVFDA